MLDWRDAAEALEAAAVLFDRPCGRGCLGRHLAVTTDEHGTTHVAPSVGDPPPPALADELARLYRRRHDKIAPARWPAPDELNPPLEKTCVGSALATRLTRGAAVALARGLATGPDFFGL